MICAAIFLAVVVGGLAIGGLVVTASAWSTNGQPGNASGLDRGISERQGHPLATGGGVSPSSGTDGIVPVSECMPFEGLQTVRGTIDSDGYYVDTPLPLCLTDEEVSDWYVRFTVVGGYTPHDSWVCLSQKGQYQGGLSVEWSKDVVDCFTTVWTATFHAATPICLDSSEYPLFNGQLVQEGTIPGKLVSGCFTMKWTGCKDVVNQGFTILLAQQSSCVLEDLPYATSPNSTF